MKQNELMRFLAPLAGEDCDWHTRHCTLLAVLDELPIGISIKDAATLRYVYRNRINAEILGLSHADSVGRTSRELFPPEVADAFESSDNEALARGSLALSELRVPGPGGAERFIQSNKTVLRDRAGAPRLIVCVFEDITEQKRMKETLLAANAELEQRVRARGEELERAYGGREAIASARQMLPDLVVLDLMMPNVNGFDVVEALKSRPETAGVPILIFTAKEITQEERARLNGYVEKVVQKGASAPRASCAR